MLAVLKPRLAFVDVELTLDEAFFSRDFILNESLCLHGKEKPKVDGKYYPEDWQQIDAILHQHSYGEYGKAEGGVEKELPVEFVVH